MNEQFGTTSNKSESPVVKTYIPRYKSSIPRGVTDALLSREQLPKEIPPLGSSIIEDFIIDKIKAGIVSPQEIADAFDKEDVLTRMDEFIENVKTRSESLNWDEVFSLNDRKIVKEKILEEMQRLEMTEDQLAFIGKLKISADEEIGISSYSEEEVYVSKLQVVRKALDYTSVFGNDIPFEEIVKILTMSTAGHEFGHQVNNISGLPVNNIPPDNNWKNGEEKTEVKSERFAEYWGRLIVEDNPTFAKARQQEWLIHLAKVTQLWDALSSYNASHEQKGDLGAIFREIDKQIGENVNVKSLLGARRLMYGGNEIENYASPYSRDAILKAIKGN